MNVIPERSRWVLVVRVDRPEVVPALRRTFAMSAWVDVVVDRRRSERRQDAARVAGERRVAGRRSADGDPAQTPPFRLAHRADGFEAYEATGPAPGRCPECGAMVSSNCRVLGSRRCNSPSPWSMSPSSQAARVTWSTSVVLGDRASAARITAARANSNRAGMNQSAQGRPHHDPPLWLDAAGRPRPTHACWTCGREVAPMRSGPSVSARTAGTPPQTLHVPDWCGCTTEYLPVPSADGWWHLGRSGILRRHGTHLDLEAGGKKNPGSLC